MKYYLKLICTEENQKKLFKVSKFKNIENAIESFIKKINYNFRIELKSFIKDGFKDSIIGKNWQLKYDRKLNDTDFLLEIVIPTINFHIKQNELKSVENAIEEMISDIVLCPEKTIVDIDDSYLKSKYHFSTQFYPFDLERLSNFDRLIINHLIKN